MKIRNRLLVVIALTFALGCDGSRPEPSAIRSDRLQLSVTPDPSEPRVGENVLWIELRSADGEPVAGARVAVTVRMHAMGAMPAMGGPAEVDEVGAGRHQAKFDLEMGGTWNLDVEAVTADGEGLRAEGSLTVGNPGVRLEAVGGDSPSRTGSAPDHAAHAGGSTSELGRAADFRIDPRRLQRIGVRTAPVVRRELETTIRAVGRVVAEETTLEDVSPKVRGWVGEVVADAVGDPVERGQVLFTVYSPELYAAQEEYLQALRSQARAQATSTPDRADYLVRAARNRLRLWDIAASDLDRLAEEGQPRDQLPVRAPVSGFVVEKNLVEGSAYMPGERLYRIAPLSRVWIEAEVYEYELPLVRVGQTATVSLPYRPDRAIEADVAYVYPTLDPKTRTARIRLKVPNADLALRPDMYANVYIRAERGERLLVPQSAVLYAGERNFVFRAEGDGRFEPQAVEVGLRSGDDVEIVSGLAEGDEIVTSGTFLIASESRLRAAMEQW